MSWSTRLERPVAAPNGAKLVTLEDAAIYYQNLSKAKRDKPLNRDAIRALMDAAEGRAPMQSAAAHLVHGPIKPFDRKKSDTPWMRRRA